MRINKDSLSARVVNIAKEKGINANVVYSRYFLTAFEEAFPVSIFRKVYTQGRAVPLIRSRH